jgi:hypothetical protein
MQSLIVIVSLRAAIARAFVLDRNSQAVLSEYLYFLLDIQTGLWYKLVKETEQASGLLGKVKVCRPSPTRR